MPAEIPDQETILRGHQSADPHVRAVVIMASSVAALIVVGLVCTGLLFKHFANEQPVGYRETVPGRPDYMRSKLDRIFPEPRLQVSPEKDLTELEAHQSSRLHSYGWVDRKAGLVHIPIERAMDLLLQKGLPVRQPAQTNSSSVQLIQQRRLQRQTPEQK